MRGDSTRIVSRGRSDWSIGANEPRRSSRTLNGGAHWNTTLVHTLSATVEAWFGPAWSSSLCSRVAAEIGRKQDAVVEGLTEAESISCPAGEN